MYSLAQHGIACLIAAYSTSWYLFLDVMPKVYGRCHGMTVCAVVVVLYMVVGGLVSDAEGIWYMMFNASSWICAVVVVLYMVVVGIYGL